MIVDAIVLSGGRSSRLGSVAKSELSFAGHTLLHRTLSTVAGSRQIVVVGPPPQEPLPDGVLRTREDPAFGGPAAGIAAGMEMLAAFTEKRGDAVLVIACDMPHVDAVIPLLVDGLARYPDADGVVPIDADGYRQLLAAGYRSSALTAAITAQHRAGSLHGLPVSRLMHDLELATIDVPDGATADVDTWEDALRWGVVTHHQQKESHE
ncbi:MAG: NTP transferase domain-containing protein [Pseudolysinimonas sp.]